MEVVMRALALLNMDFNFDSACYSPCSSTPSSPKHFREFYFSTPMSSTRVATIYSEINDHFVTRTNDTYKRDGSSSTSTTTTTIVPFDWEEKPQEPKSNNSNEDDFAFDFNGQLERDSLTVDELFDDGIIQSLKSLLWLCS